ncbi:hypothetical protein H5U98_01205 [Mycolicibacterium boenickei]|uniref:PAS domain S-box/diguanylate cyclase (GGDEF) domain-containing protein n=1 Tax=Mycolicibacterium boenickei TaxID=146017 RepID=A0AAX2ZY90_9MYCO|nr:hypothetical protein CQY21_21435 [Mycolicibacterium boenickei]UNC00106.1 hypothetical protein H5U98_01205 [Mycolicibacterium boenickei]BBX89817.1 hypothetical protein MBOE_14660 [Mycolicibacterium boenickei]
MSDIENGPDDTLSPSESTDSDEVANADGDDVVDPPEHWHGADRADEPESLESKLDAERPDRLAGQAPARDVDEAIAEREGFQIVSPDDESQDG